MVYKKKIPRDSFLKKSTAPRSLQTDIIHHMASRRECESFITRLRYSLALLS